MSSDLSPKDILLQYFDEKSIDAWAKNELRVLKASGYTINHVLQVMSECVVDGDNGYEIDDDKFDRKISRMDVADYMNSNNTTTTTRASRASRRKSRESHTDRSTSRSRQSSGQGGGGGSQGIPTTPKHKKKEPADYDEAVGKLSHTASGLKLDDDIMDVDNGGESGVTLSSKEGGVSIVDQQGTTNTSTTENNHRQGSVAEEDGVEDNDDDAKMKDTETSCIPETPKKQANNNGDEDDTKQAAVVYAVPKIEIKEVYGTDSLKNCTTKCQDEGCELSAVIRVEGDGKVFVLCNDHLER